MSCFLGDEKFEKPQKFPASLRLASLEINEVAPIKSFISFILTVSKTQSQVKF